MKERPILFSAPMVRAINAGRKTQTRRIITRLPGFGPITEFGPSDTAGYDWHFRDKAMRWHDISHDLLLQCCPYGQPGDQLWVRETWGYRVGCNIDTQYQQAVIEYNADMKQLTRDIPPGGQDKLPKQRPCGKDEDYRTYYDDYLTRYWQQWRPSIFMPRWASRILLEVVSVRVERLQDISEADAVAEGIRISSQARRSDTCYGIYECQMPDGKTHFNDSAYALYRVLWEQINGAGTWDANPWVWVVEFKRIP